MLFRSLACSDTGAVTRMLDRLEAKGLVERARSREDRRVVKLELTAEGGRAAEVVPHVLAEVLNTVLAGFNETEVLQLKAMLKRIDANARRMRESDAAAQAANVDSVDRQ